MAIPLHSESAGGHYEVDGCLDVKHAVSPLVPIQ
jgi:hypothetical protein